MERHSTHLWKYPAALLCAAALFAPSAAHAQITLTGPGPAFLPALADSTGNPNPITSPGGTVTFYGVITNGSGDTYVIDYDSIDLDTLGDPSMGTTYPDGNQALTQTNIYFPGGSGMPYFPSPDSSATYSGPLFDLTVDPSAALGEYDGTVTLFGYDQTTDPGGQLNGEMELSSANFSLTVAPAPEPGAPAAFGVALLGLAGLAARRRARA